MKKSDPLFSALYQKEHFAGSYADGLKIGKPTEYDMNLIIKLPPGLDESKLEVCFLRIVFKKKKNTVIF